MPRKNLKVNKGLIKIGQCLEEARLKRNISYSYLSKYLSIPIDIFKMLENDNAYVQISYFVKYICYLKFDKSIIEQVKKSNNKILFDIYEYKTIKTPFNEIKFLNKLVAYLIIIRKFYKINKDVIYHRSGIEINLIEKIENYEDVFLIDFMSYCNAINMLDTIVNSLTFKFDEIGNILIVQRLKEESKNNV